MPVIARRHAHCHAPPSADRQHGRIRLSAVAALLILVAGFAVAYWLLSQPPRVERRPPPETPPPLVDAVRAERGYASPQIQGYGRVEAERETRISSRVAGLLKDFAPGVAPGRIVEEGALLATIDDSDFRLALRAAEAELAQAEAALATERGEQLRAQSEYQSFGRELSAERRALVLREPQLRTAQAAVERARVSLDQARLDLERTDLFSPYRAMVQERMVGSGGEVSANSELLHLVDVASFWVRVSLPGETLDWLEIGSEVRLTSRGWPAGGERWGRVLSVLPTLDDSGLQTQLLVEVDDPLALATDGPALRLGDILRAEFTARPRADLIALPASALRPGDEVWRLDGENRLERARVEVLHRGEEQVLITSGIEEGDRVVISSLGQPRNGMSLRPRMLETDDEGTVFDAWEHDA